ncbi:MAG: dihydrofolate reductase [Alphaproteobacteria bacterium]|nr:MAG: dihydrofolate reductase [Alphaproteobacteria bacterium]
MIMVSLIVAVARNGVIGRQGGLPWHLRDDMKYFADTTRGHTVVMGRKTFESIPEKYRPLPDRRNIVVTRDTSWFAKGVDVVGDLGEAMEKCGDGEVFVIGGGEIYAQAMHVADRLYVTEIAAEVEGDVVFPPYIVGWREVKRVPHQEGEWRYDWVVYERS